MLTIKVDKHSKEPGRITACGTREDILTELSIIIASISREMAQDLDDGKALIDLTQHIMGTVTAGVRYGMHMAVADLEKKEASTDD